MPLVLGVTVSIGVLFGVAVGAVEGVFVVVGVPVVLLSQNNILLTTRGRNDEPF